jgi:hypothetical protein
MPKHVEGTRPQVAPQTSCLPLYVTVVFVNPRRYHEPDESNAQANTAPLPALQNLARPTSF